MSKYMSKYMSNKTKKYKNKSNLEILFNNVLEKSYQLRKKSPNTFDGQGFWQPIKKILEPFDSYNEKKWIKISKTKTRKIMLLPEYTINGYETKLINEKNHFIIQQVRIPLNEKLTIKKLIQIALNIGQYKGISNNNYIYNIKFNDISHFIHKKDIIELSTHISDEILKKVNDYLYSFPRQKQPVLPERLEQEVLPERLEQEVLPERLEQEVFQDPPEQPEQLEQLEQPYQEVFQDPPEQLEQSLQNNV